MNVLQQIRSHDDQKAENVDTNQSESQLVKSFNVDTSDSQTQRTAVKAIVRAELLGPSQALAPRHETEVIDVRRPSPADDGAGKAADPFISIGSLTPNCKGGKDLSLTPAGIWTLFGSLTIAFPCAAYAYGAATYHPLLGGLGVLLTLFGAGMLLHGVLALARASHSRALQ